jgi:hypothetical protein
MSFPAPAATTAAAAPVYTTSSSGGGGVDWQKWHVLFAAESMNGHPNFSAMRDQFLIKVKARASPYTVLFLQDGRGQITCAQDAGGGGSAYTAFLATQTGRRVRGVGAGGGRVVWCESDDVGDALTRLFHDARPIPPTRV